MKFNLTLWWFVWSGCLQIVKGFFNYTESMKFLEKDLEEIIYNATPDELHKRGLFTLVNPTVKRQLKIGNYGVADLVYFKRRSHIEGFLAEPSPNLLVDVFELKKDKIGISAFLQAVGYARGIKSYLDHRGIDSEVRITLIGREIDSSGCFVLIPSVFDNVRFYTYDYGIDGIKFKSHNEYWLSNEGFGNED